MEGMVFCRTPSPGVGRHAKGVFVTVHIHTSCHTACHTACHSQRCPRSIVTAPTAQPSALFVRILTLSPWVIRTRSCRCWPRDELEAGSNLLNFSPPRGSQETVARLLFVSPRLPRRRPSRRHRRWAWRQVNTPQHTSHTILINKYTLT